MDENKNPILLAQCKAFHTIEEITKEIETLLKIHSSNAFNICISLPFSYIDPITKKFPEAFLPGAEAVLNTDQNSFTGSIAGKFLEDSKVKFVLIGTPQERAEAASNPKQLSRKVKIALEQNINPYVCIGETLQEHQDKASKEVITTQLKDCLDGLSAEDLNKVHIVYNAEWICRTPWEASSPELHEAYKVFKEVVNECLPPDSIARRHLIAAVPAYSGDVSQLIKNLKSEAFVGFSLGILTESAEYLKPLQSA